MGITNVSVSTGGTSPDCNSVSITGSLYTKDSSSSNYVKLSNNISNSNIGTVSLNSYDYNTLKTSDCTDAVAYGNYITTKTSDIDDCCEKIINKIDEVFGEQKEMTEKKDNKTLTFKSEIPTTFTFTIKDPNEIVDIEVIKENKVLEFTFAYGEKIKTVCKEPDEFSFERACYIAISKKVNSSIYTLEGIEWRADQMKYEKYYNKLVSDALKLYKRKQKEEAKKIADEKEDQAVKERRRAKKAAYKKRRARKLYQKQYELQRDAMIEALKTVNK